MNLVDDAVDVREVVEVSVHVARRFRKVHLGSVDETEALVRARTQPSRKKPPKEKDADTLVLERELSDRVGAPVTIAPDSRGQGGKLVIGYSTLDELEGILAHLK